MFSFPLLVQAPLASKTPEWGARPGGAAGGGKKWEGAGPKGWRGVGEWSEDWGELNTGGWKGLGGCVGW